MKKSLFIAAVAAMFVVSACNSNGSKTENGVATASDSTEVQSVRGVWNIENIVVNDTLSVRPAEIDPEATQSFIFDVDGVVGIKTNCNSLGGSYAVKGDSIRFENMFCTEMACENMAVEDMLKQVLPNVATIDFVNDSTLRLNTTVDASYIVLSKAQESK